MSGMLVGTDAGEIRCGTRDNLLTMSCLHGSVALCICPFNLVSVIVWRRRTAEFICLRLPAASE